jgi:hypothetical protein
VAHVTGVFPADRPLCPGMETYQLAAVATATVLAVDAAIHLYWMTGRTWPARDVHTLSRAVLNADVPFTPRVLTPLVAVLTVGAAAILAKAGILDAWLPDWLPDWAPTAGTAAVTIGTLLRGGVGVIWALGIGANRNTLFYRLNLVAYTPMCLALFAAAAVVTTGRP